MSGALHGVQLLDEVAPEVAMYVPAEHKLHV